MKNSDSTVKIFWVYFSLLLLFIFIFSSGLYYHALMRSNNVTCRAEVTFSVADTAFNGIIDYKAGSDKGVVNISGLLTEKTGEVSIVNRMVLFDRTDFGVSPIWESKRIVIFNTETSMMNQMKKVIPNFFLEQNAPSDADVFLVSKNALLITKSNTPYLYCENYDFEPL